MISWHFPRADLAKQYMDAFDTGITEALTLFAPRRMGKTEFVLLDLAPEAELRGYQVGYCSFWNLQDNPAKALRIALEGISKTGKWTEKWENSAGEISTNIAGVGLKLKPRNNDSIEESDILAIIEILKKMAKKRTKTLLLLDEVQHLANEKHASLVATLRTAFDEYRGKIKVVYTGSSRDGLQRMFRDRKAPMFHAAQQVDFPHLDSNFVAFMLNAFEQASKRKVSLPKSTRIFKEMSNNPALFHNLLKHMLIKGIWDIQIGYKNFLSLMDIDADYQVIIDSCKPIDRAVLLYLSKNDEDGIYSDSSKLFVSEYVGADISVKALQNAINRLREKQLIYSPTRGLWVLEDDGFKRWIVETLE